MDKNLLSNMLYGILIGLKIDCENCDDCNKCKYYLKSKINGHNCRLAAFGDELQHAPADWDSDNIREVLDLPLPNYDYKCE